MAGELPDTVRAWLAELAAGDPARARFGARHHQYRLGAPLPAARLAAIEAELGAPLPADYRDHVGTVGDGGAGPYLGLMPLDHPIQLGLAAGTFPFAEAASPADRTFLHGVVGLAHLGCGHIALLVVRGAAAGQVWLDARGSGDGVRPTHPSFHAWFGEWVAATSRGDLPPGWVTPGRCALPSGLSRYLAAVETRLGRATGTLAGADLRQALADLGDRSITIGAADGEPFFADGDPLDPCVVCARTVENLVPQGMRWSQLAPGISPLPMRESWP